MLKKYNIYYIDDLIATIDGIDEIEVLSRFMRNGGAGYSYGRLRAKLVE